MDLQYRDQGSFHVVGFRFFGVERFDRERSTGNGKDGTSPEICREFGSVERGRSADEFEVGTAFAGLWTSAGREMERRTFHETKENVGSNGPLVSFVQHDDGVFGAIRVY